MKCIELLNKSWYKLISTLFYVNCFVTRMWANAQRDGRPALCSTPQNMADAQYKAPCSNVAKTRKPLKYAGMPQTRQQISAVSRPKFTILRRLVDEILLFN